jgi:predicted metalloprotease with PDZ domain
MHYKFSAPNPNDHLIQVEMVVNGIDRDEVLFQLPSWRPGRYELQNFAKNILQWKATDKNGEILTHIKLTKDCWKVKAEGADEIHIQFSYYAAQADAGACWVDEDLFYINPIHCCMFVPEKILEPCEVEFNLPDHFIFATALKKSGNKKFTASDYHELVDSPVMAAVTLQHHSYEVDHTVFNIWLYGDCNPDWGRLVNDFRRFTQEELKMMHDIPTQEYHFLVLALPYKFYHGVEHLHSTVLAIGPGSNIMSENLYVDFVGVASHELFHVWNIKSIRPHEMQPYDYTRENYSRLGFVYEGVTTYYGDLFLARCGVYTVPQFLKEISLRVQKHFDNYGRFNSSVADSSFDTWLDGYNRGVPNRKVSIYDEGCLIALMTDLMIRRKTNNEKSLDDVMRALYNDFAKKKIAYTEHDYISIIENLTNEGVADFFIDYVYGTEDYEPLLTDLVSHFGLKLQKSDSSKTCERDYGFKITQEGNSTTVFRIAPGSPSHEAGLGLDDEIISVNDVKVESNLNELLTHFHAAIVTLKVTTPMKKVKSIDLELSHDKYFPEYKLVKAENPSTAQQKFFSEWMKSAVSRTYSFMN